MHGVAEALTCRAAIRTAKAIVADIGEASARRSKGLVELSKKTLTNSERDCMQVTEGLSLKLPLKLTTLKKSPGVRYSGAFKVIALRAWVEFLLTYNAWFMLCGLSKPDEPRERAILSKFWEMYRQLKPDHGIWQEVEKHQVDLSRCAPLLFHGDEGRGRKRSAFMVLAFHSFLGRGTTLANEIRKHRPYLSQRLNYCGNSYTHRMLVGVFPKILKDEVAFADMLSFFTNDAVDLFERGLESQHGGRYHVAVLNVVGDWAFLAKVANLWRSYSTVEKRPRGPKSDPKGICHLCKAGQLNIPFEDFRRYPGWMATMFEPGDVPWTCRPTLLRLVHEPAKEASFFAFDYGILCNSDLQSHSWDRCWLSSANACPEATWTRGSSS